MMWDLKGKRVTGMYMGEFFVTGRVELSRVRYDGGVQHTVVLDKPIKVYDNEQDCVVLDDKNVIRVKDKS